MRPNRRWDCDHQAFGLSSTPAVLVHAEGTISKEIPAGAQAVLALSSAGHAGSVTP